MSSDQKFPELKPKIVLGIAAHPDDLDFGASGSMATFADSGADVHYLILTDGGKGSSDPNMTPAQLTALRKKEQETALKILGGKTVTFLDYPDGELEVTLKLKKDIVRVIRTIKPDVVVTMDPSMLYSAERGFINHPDHRAAGQAALDAVFPLARDHLSFPELYANGYLPHKTATVLLINFDSKNFFVDITRTFPRKIEALKAHASQIPSTTELEGFIRDIASKTGKQAGYELAEAFVRIDLRI
jgi:LmbE family N-acetylglucosaminyl deacetylase